MQGWSSSVDFVEKAREDDLPLASLRQRVKFVREQPRGQSCWETPSLLHKEMCSSFFPTAQQCLWKITACWPQHNNFKATFNTLVMYSAESFFSCLVVSVLKSRGPQKLSALILLTSYIFRNNLFLKHTLPAQVGFGASLVCQQVWKAKPCLKKCKDWGRHRTWKRFGKIC